MGRPLRVLALKFPEEINDPVDSTIEYSTLLVVPKLMYSAGLRSLAGSIGNGGCVGVCSTVPGRRPGNQRVAHGAAGHRATIARVALKKLLEVCGMLGC